MKKISLSTFSGKLASLEVYAVRGNTARVRELVREMERDIRSFEEHLDKRENRFLLQDQENARLRATMTRLRKQVKRTVAEYESSLHTFERLRKAIVIVQKMRSLKELPAMTEKVRDLMQLKQVTLVMEKEEFGPFLPGDVPTQTFKELMETWGGFSDEKVRMGQVGEFPAAVAQVMGVSRDGTGSYFLYRMDDKYLQDRPIGMISLIAADPGRYSPDKATDFLEHFCATLAGCLLTLCDREKLERDRIVDPLTRAYNRRYLDRHAPRILEFAARRNFPVSLLFIDLNNFKEVNDHLGHESGDRILQLVTKAMQPIVRKYDIFVRLGGDEFVLMLPDTDKYKAEIIRKRIHSGIEAITIPPSGDGRGPRNMSASIGIAVFEKGNSLRELIHKADQNMYKEKGRRTGSI